MRKSTRLTLLLLLVNVTVVFHVFAYEEGEYTCCCIENDSINKQYFKNALTFFLPPGGGGNECDALCQDHPRFGGTSCQQRNCLSYPPDNPRFEVIEFIEPEFGACPPENEGLFVCWWLVFDLITWEYAEIPVHWNCAHPEENNLR